MSKNHHPFGCKYSPEKSWISWKISEADQELIEMAFLERSAQQGLQDFEDLLIFEILKKALARRNSRMRLKKVEAIAFFAFFQGERHYLIGMMTDDIFRHMLAYQKIDLITT